MTKAGRSDLYDMPSLRVTAGARYRCIVRRGAEAREAVIFAVNNRPVEGTRGSYRVALRHGVSRIRSGSRYTLGVIFHDAT